VLELSLPALSLVAKSALAISALVLSVLVLSVLANRVLALSALAISVEIVPVATVSVATVSARGWEAACKGRPDPNRAMTPNPKLTASDLLWESPGAVGSSGEPVVNRLRGTTGSPGVAERG